MVGVTESDVKADLLRYLQDGRDAMLWKLDGLSEYDIRRPLVPTPAESRDFLTGLYGGRGRTLTPPSTRCRSAPLAAFPGGRPTGTR
jgi:hypothetical protein